MLFCLFIVLLTISDCSLLPADSERVSFWSHEVIAHPSHFIFGYGSLVNSGSRKNSLREESAAIPARLSPAFGYVRKWNYHADSGKTALGLEKVNGNGCSINGAIYPVKEEDLEVWDQREVRYTRVQIPLKYIEAASWQGIPQKGTLWIYVPIGNKGKAGEDLPTPDIEHPIGQAYLDLCINGFLEYGEKFTKEFLETTFGWNRCWVDDRSICCRPWIRPESFEKIDLLMHENLNCLPSDIYKARTRVSRK